MHETVNEAPARRLTATRALAMVVLAILVVYCGAIAWLMTQETRLVFATGRPFQTALPSIPYQQIEIPREDRAKQYAWVFRQPDAARSAPWILFLHGNAATIASRINISHYEHLRAMGMNVIAPEYRGYGGLPGTPSERGLEADARAAYAYLRTHERAGQVVIYGWSLGSAVAVDLASANAAAAVILEGAPASLVAIGQRQYPMFPIRLLMRNPFDSILKVGRIRAPLLFLHSPQDTLIPIEEARRLYAAAPEPKRFVEVPGGHIHSSDTDPTAFYGAIHAFLTQQHVLPQ
jgi:fermentation-respiration switch protein FrsA (DUF1100 family)